MEQPKSTLSGGKRLIYIIASIIMIGIIIAYILYYIPAGTLIGVITNFNWEWLVILFGSLFLCMLIRGYRIKVILRATNNKISYKNCVASIFGNYCINTVSPARLGDVYNVYALNKTDNIKLGPSAGTKSVPDAPETSRPAPHFRAGRPVQTFPIPPGSDSNLVR